MDAEIITLTEKAQAYLVNLTNNQDSENAGVRVSVIGGGCSGLSYKIDFGVEKDKDRILKFDNGLIVFIDPKSSIYLKGVTLDYQDGLNGKGFVFKNPNATILEKTVANALKKSLEKGSLYSLDTLMSRVYGKPKETVSQEVTINTVNVKVVESAIPLASSENEIKQGNFTLNK